MLVPAEGEGQPYEPEQGPGALGDPCSDDPSRAELGSHGAGEPPVLTLLLTQTIQGPRQDQWSLSSQCK